MSKPAPSVHTLINWFSNIINRRYLIHAARSECSKKRTWVDRVPINARSLDGSAAESRRRPNEAVRGTTWLRVETEQNLGRDLVKFALQESKCMGNQFVFCQSSSAIFETRKSISYRTPRY